MEDGVKLCVDCKHFSRPADKPKYPRCKLGDGQLCGEMRQAGRACGPEANLWEPKNG